MEDLYPNNSNAIASSCSNHIALVGNFITTTSTTSSADHGFQHHNHHHHGPQVTGMDKLLQLEAAAAAGARSSSRRDEIRGCVGSDDDVMKDQIANHPRYPNLLSAYIECRKVGAPREMASLLEEISSEIHVDDGGCCEIGADPELDDFMESYCEVLMRYKDELSKPFDEATTFLNRIETQLSNLCKGGGTSTTTNTTTTTTTGSHHHHSADEVRAGSSEEELSCADIEATEIQAESSFGPRSDDQELKEMLLRKYSGYLSSLKKEFLKKRKKGKLPKEARVTLLDWWNTHYRWPYPTEEEKAKLAEVTGLDQKQINNWFINQRKRHWKPSEDMRFALMEGVTSTGGAGGPPSYFDTTERTRTDN